MAALDTSIAQQERNAKQFRYLIEEGFSKGNEVAVDEVVAANCVEHQAGIEPANVEGLKTQIALLHQLMPDFTCTVEDLITVGENVWARLRGRGTHRGAFMGRPPTGNVVTVDVMDVCRFKDGKIVEHWGVPDRLSMLEQMGIVPRPRPAQVMG